MANIFTEHQVPQTRRHLAIDFSFVPAEGASNAAKKPHAKKRNLSLGFWEIGVRTPRLRRPIIGSNFLRISELPGTGNTNSGYTESYRDKLFVPLSHRNANHPVKGRADDCHGGTFVAWAS
jgi:hypothetical protein